MRLTPHPAQIFPIPFGTGNERNLAYRLLMISKIMAHHPSLMLILFVMC